MTTEKPGGLDELLRIDHENLEGAKRVLQAIHPKSLEYIDAGMRMFDDLAEIYGKNCKYNEHQHELDDWFRAQGGAARELASYLETAVLIGQVANDSTRVAQDSLLGAKTVIARGYLILRICRDFMLGVMELLRFRLTPAYGYLRVQTESVALFMLMGERLQLAAEWLDAVSTTEGIEFYRKWHGRLVEKIRSSGFYSVYEEGSAYALHSRVAGVGHGMSEDDSRLPGTITLTFQELADETRLLLYVCVYLRSHHQFAEQIVATVPELQTPEANAAVSEFGAMVETLWKVLRPRYQHRRGRNSLPV